MADDGGVVARGTGKSTTVSDLLLNVADDGTFRKRRDGKDVANSKGRLLAAVHECASVQTLGRDKRLRAQLVTVRVTEHNARERCATEYEQIISAQVRMDQVKSRSKDIPASVVDDFFDNAADVAVALSKVERAQLGRRLVVVRVRLELLDGRAN